MKTNLPTKKILSVIVILNIVALVSYVSFFSIIRNKNEATSLLENILDSQINRESELKLVGVSLKKTGKERVMIDSYFVQKGKGGITDFIEEVEAIADLANVYLKVNSILLREQEDLNIVEELNLGLEIKGGWFETNYFLELLELLPYQVSFDRVYLEKNEDSSLWNNIFNISILKLSDN